MTGSFRIKRDLYLIVDIESTGLVIGIDRVIQVCILETDGKNILRTIDVTIKIEEVLLDRAYRELSKIIKIDKEAIRNARSSSEVFAEIGSYFDTLIEENAENEIYLVGHNVIFDYKGILAEMNINNISSKFGKYFANRQIDTKTLAKNNLPNLTSYSLDSVAMAVNLSSLVKQRAIEGHSADLDTRITFEVFKVFHRKVTFSL